MENNTKPLTLQERMALLEKSKQEKEEKASQIKTKVDISLGPTTLALRRATIATAMSGQASSESQKTTHNDTTSTNATSKESKMARFAQLLASRPKYDVNIDTTEIENNTSTTPPAPAVKPPPPPPPPKSGTVPPPPPPKSGTVPPPPPRNAVEEIATLASTTNNIDATETVEETLVAVDTTSEEKITVAAMEKISIAPASTVFAPEPATLDAATQTRYIAEAEYTKKKHYGRFNQGIETATNLLGFTNKVTTDGGLQSKAKKKVLEGLIGLYTANTRNIPEALKQLLTANGIDENQFLSGGILNDLSEDHVAFLKGTNNKQCQI